MLQHKPAETLIEIAAKHPKERQYWHEILADLTSSGGIPGDFIAAGGEPDPAEISFAVPGAVFERLLGMSKGSDFSIHVLWLAGLAILLGKYSRQNDVLIGTPIYRQPGEFEFCNTLLSLRITWDDGDSFRDLALKARQTLQGAIVHYAYPFELLARDLGFSTGGGTPSIFDTALVIENIQDPSLLAPVRPNIAFYLCRHEEGIEGKAVFNKILYKESTIRRIAGLLVNIMRQALFDTGIPIHAIELLTHDETSELLHKFSGSSDAEPLAQDPVSLIRDRLHKNPHRVMAVDDGVRSLNRQLTGGELKRGAQALARTLNGRGVGNDCVVAIYIERSLESILCIQGILEAGGAYLPLDTGAPSQRIAYIMRDSGAPFVLSQGPLDFLPGGSVIDILSLEADDVEDKQANERVSPSSLAYVLYTSGTTGTPKGVMVERRNICYLIDALRRLVYGNGDGPKQLSLVSPFVFDASIQQTFAALMLSRTLVIVPDECRADGSRLLDVYNRHCVEVADGTPIHISMLRDAGAGGYSSLTVNYFLIGGEELTEQVASGFFERFRWRSGLPVILNVYGPTECTVEVTSFAVEVGKMSQKERIPIGKPLHRARIYILDAQLRPVPVGMAGELWISGAGVGRGYLNRVHATEERFVPDPFYPGLRMYRTGDLARWLEDGDIDYLGRMDTQVKLRGYRIELGEILHCLRKREDVSDAVVELQELAEGECHICAYLVPGSGRPLDMNAIRAYLERLLPFYMIPSFFMEIEAVPLTSNGKLNRRALPRPQVQFQEYISPAGKLEEDLVELWAEILKLEKERISVTANFFQLGGQSLLATTLAVRVEKRLGFQLPLVEIFKRPTVRGLADYLYGRPEGVANDASIGAILLRKQEKSRVNIVLIHDGSGDTDGYADLYNSPDFLWNVWGIRAQRPEGMSPQNLSIMGIAASYIKRIDGLSLPGPVHLVGWSLGGTIAFEMALQMQERTGENGFLLLIDAPGPATAARSGVGDFSMETELDLLKTNFPGLSLEKDPGFRPGLRDFWPLAAGRLAREGVKAADIVRFMPPDLARLIPHNQGLSLTELLEYVNLNRTLARSRALYIPDRSLKVPLYFLKARQTPGDPVSEWQSYCKRPVRSAIVDGDHFSIMKHPAAGAIASLVREIMADNLL